MMQKMIRRYVLLLTLAGIFLAGATGTVGASTEVDGVCGLHPVEEGAYIAVEIPLGEDQALAGLTWFNNDGQQPFSGLVLLEGQAGDTPDFNGGAMILGEIWGLSSDWSQVTLDTPVVSSTGIIHAVFVLPADGSRTGDGAFGGPGIGYRLDDLGLPCHVSADGVSWMPIHRDYGLAVEPLLTAGSSKRAPVELAALSPWDGRPAEAASATTDRPEAPRTALLLPQPNPFNPRTEIRYSLAEAGAVHVVVYDARGRRVRTLASGHKPAGMHSVTWLGRDDRGGSVASGVYYLKMDFDGQSLRRSLTLVR